MSNFLRFQEPVWDLFFDFLHDCDDALTDAQVDEELRRRGIDVTRAFSKVRQALHAAKAREQLNQARLSRPSILRRFREITGPAADAAMAEVRELIRLKSRGSVQAAFFRKLDGVASEQDLRSLVDDVHRLDQLMGESGDAES